MTAHDKPFDVAGFFELTAKQAKDEMALLASQAKWFRLLAELIEQHKSMDDTAAALVNFFGIEGQYHLSKRFDIDQYFATAMNMATQTMMLNKQIEELSSQKTNHKD